MTFTDKQNPHSDPRIPYLNSYAYILDKAYSDIATSMIPMSTGYTDGSISWEDIEDPFGLAAQIEEEMGEQFVSVIAGLKVAEHAVEMVKERILSEVAKEEDSDIWQSLPVVAPEAVSESERAKTLIRQIELSKVVLPALEILEKTMAEIETLTGIDKNTTHYYPSVADDFCDEICVRYPQGYTMRINLLSFFTHSSYATRSVIDQVKSFVKKGEEELQSIGVVYLIGSDKARVLKIGHTKKNVEERLKELQAGRAYKLRVIKTKPGTFKEEKAELLKARRFQVHGEWFTWDDSIIENF